MIENFGDLRPEEQARLVENERRNIERSNEALHTKAGEMRAQNEQLEVLVAQKRALVERMREVVRELDEENSRIEREMERILAHAS